MQAPPTGVTTKVPTIGSADVLAGKAPLYGFAKPQPWHREQQHDRPHWVYVVANTGIDGPVKIGITNSLSERVWQLSAGYPEGVEILASYETTHWLARQIERRIHAEFEEYALGREWFDLAAADVRPALEELIEWAKLAAPHMALG